ncbi:hypothetical protein EX30DRAFT_159688 [Ascodesmis nigricans]|uniref:Uncharacterized protein n=1 Tax=Ascodesmis nigricans TaxID=341454 RepID=A0A4S2MMM2_9PEZI|nr:hypothetical protein EX30DRAFT_159688 [Ascodesmis nigricans]
MWSEVGCLLYAPSSRASKYEDEYVSPRSSISSATSPHTETDFIINFSRDPYSPSSSTNTALRSPSSYTPKFTPNSHTPLLSDMESGYVELGVWNPRPRGSWSWMKRWGWGIMVVVIVMAVVGLAVVMVLPVRGVGGGLV